MAASDLARKLLIIGAGVVTGFIALGLLLAFTPFGIFSAILLVFMQVLFIAWEGETFDNALFIVSLLGGIFVSALLLGFAPTFFNLAIEGTI